jgi:hypothetical protein
MMQPQAIKWSSCAVAGSSCNSCCGGMRTSWGDSLIVLRRWTGRLTHPSAYSSREKAAGTTTVLNLPSLRSWASCRCSSAKARALLAASAPEAAAGLGGIAPLLPGRLR